MNIKLAFILLAFVASVSIRSIQYKNFSAQGAHSYMINLQAIEISRDGSFNLDRPDVEVAGDYFNVRGHTYHPYTPLPSIFGAVSHSLFFRSMLSNLLSNRSDAVLLVAHTFSLNLLQYILVCVSAVFYICCYESLNLRSFHRL